jgi:chemotaxis protein CheC
MMKKNLTTLQKDALYEVVSIGMHHASTALSHLVKDEITVKLDSLDLVTLTQLPPYLYKENVLSTGVYLRITGDLSGTTLLVFPHDTALTITDILHNRAIGETSSLGRDDKSGIEELGSILTASFLNALSDFLKIRLVPSTPSTVFDVSKSIRRFVLIGVKAKDQCLITKVSFVSAMGIVEGNFIFLLDSDSLSKLIPLIDARIQKNKK